MPKHERAPITLDDATITEIDSVLTCDWHEVRRWNPTADTDKCGAPAPIATRCENCDVVAFSCVTHIKQAFDLAADIACGACGQIAPAAMLYEVTVL
jgi:hypothetical protein